MQVAYSNSQIYLRNSYSVFCICISNEYIIFCHLILDYKITADGNRVGYNTLVKKTWCWSGGASCKMSALFELV